ncbi:ABC transporter ATPase [Bacillus sp. T33-2]|uniref:ABC transporter ATPase n=1 Tax=Bacillus sp. T33-2 TaxID=2054168 RepID=UPI000C79017E|nr:ABC transporter ATPase [Bacillus sp. T33-2]PLR95918.1 ABC transporter ATPase [Bacillus sp. T33-2]
MFRNLCEEDFALLRGPLESGRQSPNSLGGILFLGCFLQWLLFYLIYTVTAEMTVYPNVESIKTIHFWSTIVLTILSAIFAISAVYKKFEKSQYIVSIIVSQNLFGIFLYLGALFSIGQESEATEEFLITFTYITLGVAAALFLATFMRLYLLLKNGRYREGSAKGEHREKFDTTSYIPVAIVGSTGIVLIIISLIRNGLIGGSFETVLFTVLPLLIFYTMIFVLPEQLVILYCKYRFKSFNFNESGFLYPMEEMKPISKRVSKRPVKIRKG